MAAARQRQAVAGEYGGGRRPFGFDEDGLTVRPDEAAVIKDCTKSKLSDPGRRVGPGAAPKWLGTNVYTCGICTPEDYSTRVGVRVRLVVGNRRTGARTVTTWCRRSSMWTRWRRV